MNYLLDTCVFAEYAKPRPNAAALEWIESQEPEALFISVLAVGEIKKGIAKLPASKRRKELERFLESLVHRFDRRILSLDISVTIAWGALAGRLETKGHKTPVIDSLLAATALEHDLTIVTRNVTDFARTGARVLNIWD